MSAERKANVVPLHPRNGRKATPIERAAVIIAVLGEEAARPIVGKLNDESMAKVAAALGNIQYLAREELLEIVADFITQLRRSEGSLRGGPSMARELINKIADQTRTGAIFGEAEIEEEKGPVEQGPVWKELEQRDPEEVARYLDNLTPNLIALILRKVSAVAASDIAKHFEEDMLREIMGFMINASTPDPEVESVLERMIRMDFLNTEEEGEEDNAEHLEYIGEILSLIPSSKRNSLVDFLKGEFTEKLTTIEQGLFTIDSLPNMLPRVAVPTVFRELGNDRMVKVISALQAEYKDVVDYFFGSIPSRMAEQFRLDLDGAKKPEQAEAEEIQREFLTDLFRLKRRGVIKIEKGASEG